MALYKVKSKQNIMQSNIHIQNEVNTKKSKRENAPDITSKINSISINLKFNIMSNLKNHVQLIGHLGDVPKITLLESGKKVARFSLATNEYFKDSQGEKQTSTNWHTVVAWGKLAEVLEKYTDKGKEIALVGKLKSRSYTNKEGEKRAITEVEAREILLLGGN